MTTRDQTEQTIRRPLAVIAALASVTMFLAACNTVEGFGRDLEAAGESISGDDENDDE